MPSKFLSYEPTPPPPPATAEPSFGVLTLRALGVECLIAIGIALALGVILVSLGYAIGPL